MYEFQLASGRSVGLYALHIWPTYAGVLVGGLSERFVRDAIAEAAHALEPLWSERPTHVIEPQMKTLEPSRYGPRIQLPAFRYHAWLHSEPLDPKWFGSELVLAFFADETPSPFELVKQMAADLPWEQLAGDFDP